MKTLVVKTHAFGDALLSTPAVAALVASGERVTVLAGPSSLPVWERFPGVERVVVSPAPCSKLRLLRWSLKSRQRGYDRVIHLGSSAGAARWLRFLTGQKVVSGAYRNPGFGLLKPAALDYCRIAGVQCSDTKPIFPVRAEEYDYVEKITGADPYVVLAPGGGRNARDFVPEKRWHMTRWNRVSLFLSHAGYRVFLVGDRFDAGEISSVHGVNLSGRLTWGQTAALISRAAVFAGNDSGPAHIAVAGGTKALVIFGPTDPDSLYTKGSIVPVCATVPCSPCYSNSVFPGCTAQQSCMASIETERVLNTLEGML